MVKPGLTVDCVMTAGLRRPAVQAPTSEPTKPGAVNKGCSAVSQRDVCSTLIQVAPRGWVEVGKLEGAVVYDKDRDFPGPVNIATAFERTIGDRQQRAVVVGNAGFLSNTFLGNGGNLDLGVNMVNWLSGDDRLITIQPRPAPDSNLEIQPYVLYFIAFTLLLALPLAFTITGAVIWWRRRKS